MIFSFNKEAEKTEEATPPPNEITTKNDSDPRIIGICGDLDEEKAGDLMYGIMSLLDDGTTYTVKNPQSEKPEITVNYEPFEFVISTLGGSAQEMFGLHDLMRAVREKCEIHTVGLGQSVLRRNSTPRLWFERTSQDRKELSCYDTLSYQRQSRINPQP